MLSSTADRPAADKENRTCTSGNVPKQLDNTKDNNTPSPSKEKKHKCHGGVVLDENASLILRLAGKDLANVEGWMGCSDPFFAIESPMNGLRGTTLWQNVVRSTHIDSNLNPWWDPVEVNLDLLCKLDLKRPIRICVYDFESTGKHNPMGSFETSVYELFEAKSNRNGDQYEITKTFEAKQDGKDMGKLVVLELYFENSGTKPNKSNSVADIEDYIDAGTGLRLTLEGDSMSKMNWFGGAADVFWQAETPLESPDGSVLWQSVHQSEAVMDSLSPRWNSAEINLDLLCQLDMDKPIRFSFFDWEGSMKHQSMGYFLTNASRLLRSKQDNEKDYSKALITKSETGEEHGFIFVVDVELVLNPIETPVIPKTIDSKETRVLRLVLEGVDFANMDGPFDASDPFYLVETPVVYSDGTLRWDKFYGSEVIMDNLNPKWKPALLDLKLMCKFDIDMPIRMSFFDWEENKDPQDMGYTVTSVRRLLHSKATKDANDKWDMSKALVCLCGAGKEFGKVVITEASLTSKSL